MKNVKEIKKNTRYRKSTRILTTMSTIVMTAVENMKSTLTTIMQDEIEVVLTRLRRKIFEVLEVEDDLDINLETFTKNTIKKIFSSDEVVEVEKELKKVVHEFKGEKKLKKDPDAPRGVKNAFIFFCADNRDEVKEENPTIKIKDLSKKLGEMWKEVDEDLKVEYQEKARNDKSRYERELEDYIPKEGYKNPKDKKKRKVKSDSPKRGRSSYIFFCKENREEVSGMGLKNTDILKKLGEMWKGLDDQDKKKYVKMAEDDKDRYEEEMKMYIPEESSDNDNKKKSKKSVTKRSPSSYMLFCKDFREEVKKDSPDMKFGDITKALGQMWRDLSDKKKKKYSLKAAELKNEFLNKKNNDKNEDNEDNESLDEDSFPLGKLSFPTEKLALRDAEQDSDSEDD